MGLIKFGITGVSWTATDPKQLFEKADQMLSRVAMLRTSLVLLLAFAASTACSPNETPVKAKIGELEQLDWPVDEGAVAKAWETEQSDIRALRSMVDDSDFSSVALFGDILDIRTSDNKTVAVEELTNSDEWIALMDGTSTTIIGKRIGITTLIVTPPRTADDTTVFANYIYHHPLPAMQCSEQYRDVSCGICDIALDDDWSLRLTWSSGGFEVERSENRSKYYQDKDSSLSVEEIQSTYDESKRTCMKSGLAEMGYENPEDVYSIDGGPKKREANSTNGEREGPFIVWHESGQKKAEINFVSGKPEGPALAWHANGQKQREDSFVNGELEGLSTEWYENGQKKRESHYVGGNREGLVTEWYENGQKEREIHYVSDDREGLTTRWYENGRKEWEAGFVDGEQEGLATEWYESGQKRVESIYVSGEREGLSTEWYESGPKKKEAGFVNGEQEGLFMEWYESGQKRVESYYVNGVREGMRTEWYKSGRKIFEGNFRNGIEIPGSKRWDEDGNAK